MPTPTPTTDRPHLKALTSLRIFAALHVVIFHFGREFADSAAEKLRAGGGVVASVAAEALQGLVHSGYVGVSLFFVLSGFILAYNYLDRFAARTISAREFWLARFARIYPVYFAGLVIAAPFAILHHLQHDGVKMAAAKLVAVFAASASLVQAWSPQTALRWNGPGWSLSDEAFFYLLFPLLAWPMVRHLGRRGLAAGAAGMWLAGMAIPILYILLRPDGRELQELFANGALTASTDKWLEAMKFSPLARLAEFLLGIFLGKLYLDDLAAGRSGRGAWIAAPAAILIFLALACSNALPYPLLHNGLLAPLFGLLILGLAHGRRAGLLTSRPLVLLGEASYSVYILHVPIGWGLIALAWFAGFGDTATPLEFPRPMPGIPFLLAYIAILLAVSTLSFLYLETPARGWIRRALSRRSAPSPSPARVD